MRIEKLLDHELDGGWCVFYKKKELCVLVTALNFDVLKMFLFYSLMHYYYFESKFNSFSKILNISLSQSFILNLTIVSAKVSLF